MQIYVSYTSYCTSDESSDEQYGDWSSSHEFSVDKVSIGDPSGYDKEIFEIDANLTPGMPIHVLWMRYTTGDSFGSADGNGEVIWAFANYNLARNALALWKDNSKTYSISFIVDGGEKKTLNNPGAGYFETVEDLQLQTFILE